MSETVSETEAQERDPNLPVRALRKLRRDGLTGAFRALKGKLYRRKDMAVCVREQTAPLREIRRVFCEGVYFEEASPVHLDVMSENFPHKREWYRERLETPGYYCSLAMKGGKVLAHNWFCTVPHRDPEMRCTIDPGEGGCFWFEGWCREEWRGKGVGALGMNECFGHLFPKYGIKHCMTLLEWNNVATRRMHRKWHFEDRGRRIHVRLGPLRWTSRVLPIPPRYQVGSNGQI